MSHKLINDDTQNVTVAQWQANRTSLDAGPPFNIDDTAAHISAALNQLDGDSNISQIIISDNLAVAARVNQLTIDSSTLSKLINQNGSPATLNVKDTAAHIASGFATVGTDAQVSVVTVTDNAAVTVTASQVTNNLNVLNEIINQNGSNAQIVVKDSAANLATALDTLATHLTGTHAAIASIVVNNSLALTLTATQIANDGAALALISNNNGNPVSFKVADTAASITAHLDALQANAQISTITDTDNGAITVSVAQITADAGTLNKVVNANASPITLIVNDTASVIQGAFDTLNNNSQITKIVVNDSASHEVTITVSQLSSDSQALSHLFKANGTTAANVEISDTAAHISNQFDTLNSNTQVDKIVIAPTAALSLSAGQVASDTAAFAKISGVYTIHVTDTAAHITTNLDALAQNGNVTQVVISDNAAITVTVGQLNSDALVIGDLQNSDASAVQLTVSDLAANISGAAFNTLNTNSEVTKIIVSDSATNEVMITVNQASTDTTALGELVQANGTTPAHVAVLDSAAHIGNNFGTLNGNSHIDRIIVSDSNTNEVTLTVSQAVNNATALSELFQSDGITAAHVAVSDTAAHIANSIDSLNGIGQIDKIIVNDSGANEVTITAAQAGNDGVVLGELFLVGGTTPAHVAVSDNAANIAGAFDALNGNAHVDKIIVSNSNSAEVTLTVAQVTNDGTALGKLLQSDGSTPASVAVSDSALNIQNGFDTLNGNTHIDKIIVNNSGAAEVTISVLQAGNDAAALGKLVQSNGTTPAHVAVSDTAANIAGGLNALNGNTHVDKIIVNNSGSAEVTISVTQFQNDTTALGELKQSDGTSAAHVAVSDAASSIAGAFDALSSSTQVDKIIVNDGNEVTISVAQAGSDTAGLGKLFLANGTTPAHVAVEDTALAISGAFDALNGNTHVDKIIVNNGNVPVHTPTASLEVTISVSQSINDTTALNELVQLNGSPAHVAVTDAAATISSNFDALSGNTHVDRIIVNDSATHEVTISVAQHSTDTAALAELVQSDGATPATIAISDTAAAIQAAFGALNADTQVDKIIVNNSGSAEVTITAAQAAADARALGELVQANGTTPAHVAVSDSALNVQNAFDALNGNAHVDKIIVNDSGSAEVTINALQAGSDTTALGELVQSNGSTPANVKVLDIALNIGTSFDALSSNSQVDKIVVSDSTSNEVSISAAQAASDTNGLNKLFKSDGTTPAKVTVADSAANISTALDALNGNTHVDHITISPSAALSLSAVQVATDTTALGEITNPSYLINVTDTAAHITSNLDALQANGHVNAITVSDNAEITVSVAQLTSDATMINELVNANASPVHVIVADTAAHISTAFDSLSGSSKVNSIVVSDSATHEVTITASQAASDTAALNELVQANGSTPATVAVQDTASAITSALNALNTNTHVDKIIVSDSATHEVSVSVAQIASDANALSELFNADGSTHAHVAVSDNAASITTALDSLSGNTQVNKIVVSDSASNEVTVTVAQLSSDATALAELFKANGTTAATITVSDTAASIQTALDSLNGNTQVDHIVISDNGTLTLSASQAVNDSTAIGELSNANSSPVQLTVSDIAANITAFLDQLNGESNISSIVISDNQPLTLSAGQITSDATALGKLSNADASGVEINVVDTGAHISANLEALQGNSDIVSITVSDNAPITVTVAQITSDAVVLSELVNQDNSPVLLTVRDTVANIRSNLASLNQNSQITSVIISNNLALKLTVAQLTTDAHLLTILHNANGSPYTLNIADSAAHLSDSVLDTLNANTHITAISVTDNAAISLTVGQITSDANALSLLSNANASAYTLSVHDAASAISTSFDALNNNSHVVKITVSDSATNEVSITVTQFSTDTTALSHLFQANGTTQAHVKVADAASAISGAFDSLSAAGQVDRIVVTDSATHEVQVSINQLTSDAAGLAELFKADGTTQATVTVLDSASDITTALGSLNTASQVDKIIVSDSATNEVLVSSIANITANAAALAELYKADGTTLANYAVSDNAVDVTMALDTLNGNARLDKIIVTDSSVSEVQVTVGQLTSDATALAELYNANGTTHASVVVSDTAGAIQTAFDALSSNSQVNKIIVSDSASNEVTLSALQAASDGHAISELYQADGSTHAHVAVSDIAENISDNFNALSAQGAVNKIVVTDSATNEVTLSTNQVTIDGAALNELFQADGTTPAHVAVSDVASQISANIAFLNSSAHVDHIIISDGNPLVLTTFQATHDTAAFAKIVGDYAINVLDTATHISGNLDALEANTSISLVVVSDDKPVTVSIAQLTTDADVLGEMIDQTGGGAAALRVLDTAANIQANLGNLNADLSLYNITQVTISDSQAITLTAAQFLADSAILADLRNADKTPVQLTVSDTAAHLAADLDAFQAYNTAHPSSKIASIVVSNNVAMTLTATQIATDAAILAEVTNRNASQVTFKVSDTAASISANLNQLKANGHIASITVTDNLAIALTVAQLSADASVLAKLHNQDNSAYTLNVTDTASDITAALGTLNANTHVSKIIVSDSGTNEVHATLFQLNNDTSVFSHLFNSDGTTHAGVVLADSSAHIDGLSAGQIATLAGEGVNAIDSTNDKVIFSVAQYEAVNSNAIHLTAGDTVTLSDTAAHFAGMSAMDLGALHAQNVDKVILTGTGEFAVDHWNALANSGVAITTTGATITIDGTSGNDAISTVGSGTFVLNGGAGADSFTIAATAHDTFVYGAASDSTGANYDSITGYNTSTDLFQVANAVTGVNALVHGALDSGANFDTELASAIGAGQLAGNHAVLFTVNSGTLSGHTFLIVDQNGQAGYQSGQDLVIDVTGGAHLGSLNTADFTTVT